MLLEVDKDNFQKEVLEAEEFVLVDYWSESCEPCKALMPAIMELAEKYNDNMKFCKLETTKARRLAIKEKVLGLPTIAVYGRGVKLEELTNENVTPENIEAMIRKFIYWD
ncbi:thioredoxin TrxA [Clostridium aceticum]|uniref:Thioredoxin TrxA n=1 Tax=Clostridium aceticum TaxID=84022 RepID=A0A0D8ICC2_9CLOT|nr:thioredoxin domain-containing protein [Clostridium aceticum]AKL96903.1 thioredoxin TrxA [Clostridium aceticum]KJF27637.1 thioredoxin [Clostridium aceticum]